VPAVVMSEADTDGSLPDLAKPKREDFLVNASSDAGEVGRSVGQSVDPSFADSNGLKGPA
jgi:hypothetical protein